MNLPSSDLAGPGIRTYERIADSWKLGKEERAKLIGVSDTDYTTLVADPTQLSDEVLESISLVLGIYRALHALFPHADQAAAWVRRPNSAPLFGGRPAIDLMLSSRRGLASVRMYLDAQVEGP